MKYVRLVVVMAVAVGAVYGLVRAGQGTRIVVDPGTSLSSAMASADEGATLVLAAGTHRGPLVVDKKVTVTGEDGAVVEAARSEEAAVVVRANGARLHDIAVKGGSTGVLVREVEGVVLERVHVAGARLHGIEIVDASARITAAAVRELHSDLAQGIEIRNSDGRPDSIVEDTRVVGGQEGIVSHVSEVILRDNHVEATTMRGIAVTEMSDGWVTGNRVVDARGSGYYCGDMSRCSFDANVADGIARGGDGTSNAGWGLVVTYHAHASSAGNHFAAAEGETMTSLGGVVQARSPLDPGSISDLVAPGLISLGVVLLLCLVGFALGRMAGKRFRVRERPATVGAGLAFVLAFGVQTFHMFEHGLQVYRVNVDHVPSRGGLAGPGVDAEWVHFAYNFTLLLLLVAAVVYVPSLMSRNGSAALTGAIVIQGWHGAEHFAKVVQHVTTGAKVNPGLLGGYFDLVWFHFTINLAVYALCVVAVIAWGRALLAARHPRLRSVRPVPAG